MKKILRFVGITLLYQHVIAFALMFVGAYAATRSTYDRMNRTYVEPLWEKGIHIAIAFLTLPLAVVDKTLPALHISQQPLPIILATNAFLTASLLLGFCALLRRVSAQG